MNPKVNPMLSLGTDIPSVKIPKHVLLAMAARHKKSDPPDKDAFVKRVIACCNAAFDANIPEHQQHVRNIITEIWDA